MKLLYIYNISWFFCSHRLLLAKKLIKTGHEIHLICKIANEDDRIKIESAGIKIYDINITSSSNRVIISKDSEGNPNLYNLKLIINMEIIENGETIVLKKFSESFDYKNQSNLFNLKKYEDNILDNLSEKIYEKIILYLYTI